MQRVFLLGDLKVSSIMTHKSDIVWLDMDMTADEVRAVVNENLFEFYPIADGEPGSCERNCKLERSGCTSV